MAIYFLAIIYLALAIFVLIRSVRKTSKNQASLFNFKSRFTRGNNSGYDKSMSSDDEELATEQNKAA